MLAGELMEVYKRMVDYLNVEDFSTTSVHPMPVIIYVLGKPMSPVWKKR
jgi:hypothetical protein